MFGETQILNDLKILSYTELKEKIQENDVNVLIIDFYFSFKILTGGNPIPDIYVTDLTKIIKAINASRVEFIMDDNLYTNFKEKYIDPIKEFCANEGIGGLVVQVPAKKILSDAYQRADTVIASRLGFYYTLVDNIFLFSGDSDFVPAVKYLVRYSPFILNRLGINRNECRNVFVLYSDKAKYKTEFLEFFGGKSEIEEIKNSCFLVKISSITGRSSEELIDFWE